VFVPHNCWLCSINVLKGEGIATGPSRMVEGVGYSVNSSSSASASFKSAVSKPSVNQP
jgi:hypothetical protein